MKKNDLPVLPWVKKWNESFKKNLLDDEGHYKLINEFNTYAKECQKESDKRWKARR